MPKRDDGSLRRCKPSKICRKTEALLALVCIVKLLILDRARQGIGHSDASLAEGVIHGVVELCLCP